MSEIVCLDFDGIILSSAHSEKDSVFGPPNPGAFEFIHRLKACGIRVAVYSKKSKTLFGRMRMRKWTKRHLSSWKSFGDSPFWWKVEVAIHGPFSTSWKAASAAAIREFVNSIEWPKKKPASLLTVEDLISRFNGSFPTIDAILASDFWKKEVVVEVREC